jgi:hypothetical protein
MSGKLGIPYGWNADVRPDLVTNQRLLSTQAVLGCQPDQFAGCYAQRVCHSVEEVDLQRADLGVAFDDIRQALHDRDFILGIELPLHAAYNDLRSTVTEQKIV